jgi:hypothetical protein
MMGKIKSVVNNLKNLLKPTNDLYDYELPEGQYWVPYVFKDRDSLINYTLGHNYASMQVNQASNMVIQEMFIDSLDDEDLEELTDEDLPYYDFDTFLDANTSVVVTGILPNGEPTYNYNSSEINRIIKEEFYKFYNTSYNKDNMNRDGYELNYEQLVKDKFLHIECVFCGVPHEYNNTMAIPIDGQKCVCCGKQIIQFTNHSKLETNQWTPQQTKKYLKEIKDV